MIVGINFVLRQAAIFLIEMVGYNTQTEQLLKTTTLTFVV
jgi:hypothetical protein